MQAHGPSSLRLPWPQAKHVPPTPLPFVGGRSSLQAGMWLPCLQLGLEVTFPGNSGSVEFPGSLCSAWIYIFPTQDLGAWSHSGHHFLRMLQPPSPSAWPAGCLESDLPFPGALLCVELSTLGKLLSGCRPSIMSVLGGTAGSPSLPPGCQRFPCLWLADTRHLVSGNTEPEHRL